MKTNARCIAWALAAMCFQVGTAVADAGKIVRHLTGDEAHEVAFLVAAATPESLAAASLLAHLVEPAGGAAQRFDSTALIRRAVALAPGRPELLWLALRDCELRRCAEEQTFVARLRAADPDNGVALLSDLRAAQGGTPEETTRIVAALGASRNLNIYWNKSLVMLFDALTHGPTARPATALTHDPDDRLTHAAGVLTAVDIPPFKPITTVCSVDQFRESGRRAACEGLMARLDASDSIIAQSLSVSVQRNWWPGASAQGKALLGRHLQQEYVVQASGRIRGDRVNQDAEIRIAALRRTSSEKDADDAVLSAFHEPLQRPAEWQAADGT